MKKKRNNGFLKFMIQDKLNSIDENKSERKVAMKEESRKGNNKIPSMNEGTTRKDVVTTHENKDKRKDKEEVDKENEEENYIRSSSSSRKKTDSKMDNEATGTDPIKSTKEKRNGEYAPKIHMNTNAPSNQEGSHSKSSANNSINSNSNMNSDSGRYPSANGSRTTIRENSVTRDNRGGGGGGGGRNRYAIGGQSNSNRSVGDDYMTIVSDMIYPKVSFGDYASRGNVDEGEYALERINTLGILLCGARRPTTFEKWNPYEIALFEGAISLYGKEFHQIAKIIQTKTCKECIEFYYVWKKTYHYSAWKKSFERTNKFDDEALETEIDSGGGTNSHQQDANFTSHSNGVNTDDMVIEN